MSVNTASRPTLEVVSIEVFYWIGAYVRYTDHGNMLKIVHCTTIYLITIIMIVGTVQAGLVERPAECTVTKMLDHYKPNITLRCSTNLSDVRWSKQSFGDTYARDDIYTFGYLLNDEYIINTSIIGQYDLIVEISKPNFAGRYICFDDSGFGESATADVFILLSNPSCLQNSTSSIVEGDIVLQTCTVAYYGLFTPRAKWTTSDDDNIQDAVTTVKNGTDRQFPYYELMSYIRVLARSENIRKHKFTLDFNALSTPANLHDIGALSEGTNCVYDWTFSETLVMFPVRNVKVQYFTTKENHTQLLCTADGNPEPKYVLQILWNETSAETEGSTLTVYSLSDIILVKCIASNVIRTLKHVQSALFELRAAAESDYFREGQYSQWSDVALNIKSDDMVTQLFQQRQLVSTESFNVSWLEKNKIILISAISAVCTGLLLLCLLSVTVICVGKRRINRLTCVMAESETLQSEVVCDHFVVGNREGRDDNIITCQYEKLKFSDYQNLNDRVNPYSDDELSHVYANLNHHHVVQLVQEDNNSFSVHEDSQTTISQQII